MQRRSDMRRRVRWVRTSRAYVPAGAWPNGRALAMRGCVRGLRGRHVAILVQWRTVLGARSTWTRATRRRAWRVSCGRATRRTVCARRGVCDAEVVARVRAGTRRPLLAQGYSIHGGEVSVGAARP